MFSAKALRKYSTTSQVSTPRPCPEASTVYDFNSSKPRFCPRLTSWTIHTVATLSGPFPVACGDRTQFNQKVNGICFARKSSDFRRLSPVSGTRFFFWGLSSGTVGVSLSVVSPMVLRRGFAQKLQSLTVISVLYAQASPQRPESSTIPRFPRPGHFHALGLPSGPLSRSGGAR